jgi:hypothetical protein
MTLVVTGDIEWRGTGLAALSPCGVLFLDSHKSPMQ